MDLFDHFYGNKPLISALRASIRLQRLSHAILLKGPAGSGRRTLARMLAASAVCLSESGRPCGVCLPCRKAAEGIHPDIIELAGDGEITADVVRGVRAGLFIKPNESDRRVLLIPDAERMNRFAANALLAVLEEPPTDTLFLLTARDELALLPTTRSRCQVFSLVPLPEEVLREALRERAPEAPEALRDLAVDRSGGYLGPALSQLEAANAEDGAPTSALKAALLSGSPRALAAAVRQFEGMKRPLQLLFLTDMKEEILDAMRKAFGLPGGEFAAAAAKRYPVSSLLRFTEALDRILLHCEYRVGAGNLAGELLVSCVELAA